MCKHIFKQIERLLISSWWLILFFLCCYLAYERALVKRERDFAKLHVKYLELQKEHKQALNLQSSLMLQINSQSDPEWVELTLMKGLGLVPDGQIKVVFKEE